MLDRLPLLWHAGLRLSVLLVVAGVLWTGLGVPAAEARAKCPIKARDVVAISKQASVYAVGVPGDRAYYGCDRRTGRSVRLTLRSDGVNEATPGPVLNGRYVALSVRIDERSPDGLRNVIRAFDLRTRRKILDTPQFLLLGSLAGTNASFAPSLSVNSRGDVAWTSENPSPDPTRDVRFAPRGGPVRLLDQSPSIDLTSLALGQLGVYWLNNGPRFAAR